MAILKKLTKSKDFYASICLYILSIYIYLESNTFPVIPRVPRAQNPDFYPKLIAGTLFVLSTVYLVQIVLKIMRAAKTGEETEEKAFWANSTRQTKLYLLIGLLMVGVYLILLGWVGFATAIFVFFLVIARMLGPKDKKFTKTIAATLIITVILYLVFDLLVGIRFPKGILF